MRETVQTPRLYVYDSSHPRFTSLINRTHNPSKPYPHAQALLLDRLPRGCLLNRRRPSIPILVLRRRPLVLSSSTADARLGTLTSTSVDDPAVAGASSVASLVKLLRVKGLLPIRVALLDRPAGW